MKVFFISTIAVLGLVLSSLSFAADVQMKKDSKVSTESAEGVQAVLFDSLCNIQVIVSEPVFRDALDTLSSAKAKAIMLKYAKAKAYSECMDEWFQRETSPVDPMTNTILR